MFEDILPKKKLRDDICPYCYRKDIEEDGDARSVQYGWVTARTEQPMKCTVCENKWVLIYDWMHILIAIDLISKN
jgi:hypothetical protein